MDYENVADIGLLIVSAAPISATFSFLEFKKNYFD